MNRPRSRRAGLLRQLADTHQRVVSDWRAVLLERRDALREGKAPRSASGVRTRLRRLQAAGDLEQVVAGVYVVDAPFAAALPVSESAVVMECDPWAALSHQTAMLHHGLTDDVGRAIWATSSVGRRPDPRERPPLGTTREEWIDVAAPARRHPKSIRGVPVHWVTRSSGTEFGIVADIVDGQPAHVTDLERTLLDVLREPEYGGGFARVAAAWNRASGRIDIGRLVQHTEATGSPVMRQRVGYILDRLGVCDGRVEGWRTRLQRGSSIVLVAGRPFAREFDPRWNLSLNATAAELAAFEADES